MSREVEWDGRIWPSIAAAARAEGVATRTMRLWLGLTPERPLSYPTPVRGVVYPSMSDAAKALGVTRCTVSRAAMRGTLDNVGLRKARLGNVWGRA